MKLDAEEVVLLEGSKEIARHTRLYGRQRMSLKLEHYLPLLARKHRALDRALPVRNWLAQVPACWPRLLAELRDRAGEVDGSKQFLSVLQLCPVHGLEATTRAVERTLASAQVSPYVVRYHLGLEHERGDELPESIPRKGPDARQGSPQDYMEVLHG
jgi:hypothetical protein